MSAVWAAISKWECTQVPRRVQHILREARRLTDHHINSSGSKGLLGAGM